MEENNQNKNNNILKKPWVAYTRKEKWLVVGGILLVLWFVGLVQMAVLGGKNYQPTPVQTSQPQTQPSQPKTQAPTLSLPKYEKLPYGIAQNSILVSPSISIEQLKLLIAELPMKLCSNPKVCLINIYDNADATRTDADLTDEFLDFAEKHFIGQYSLFGGNPIRRYKVNGQWVNF